ncbi:SDR family oxidoreductase [Alicyclobacillus mengziensis]|uniref:SDR family oxidoreductase n=1 Tax=Alicyclobacillus mengziensis TaxID=2931921 RepID=A0A9X7W030_9BACL|nr:SDR family oxidoreductase [Alicyclobacillus mengziensis]QSO46883.1 SDR family oxidoreductase [Alicyclobacillus mengziensis]
MDLGLRGKRALVTAASQGLGLAIATELTREGCEVVISSRRAETLTEVARNMNAALGPETSSVRAVKADLVNEGDIRELVARTAKLLGGIDILVTNAGGPVGGNFDQVTDEDWQRAFDLNMMSVVRLIRETLPYMRRQGGGKILNISSLYVRQPNVNLILSNAIRTGTMALLKTLALQVAQENIAVLNFAPGRINTDRVKWLDEQRASREGKAAFEVAKEEAASIPMGRYGEPEEVGRLVTMLLSSANSYMTGQTILADGGVISAL